MHYRNEKSPDFLNKCSDLHPRQSLFGPLRVLFHSFSVSSQHEIKNKTKWYSTEIII
jgi:hypothetical protein